MSHSQLRATTEPKHKEITDEDRGHRRRCRSRGCLTSAAKGQSYCRVHSSKASPSVTDEEGLQSRDERHSHILSTLSTEIQTHSLDANDASLPLAPEGDESQQVLETVFELLKSQKQTRFEDHRVNTAAKGSKKQETVQSGSQSRTGDQKRKATQAETDVQQVGTQGSRASKTDNVEHKTVQQHSEATSENKVPTTAQAAQKRALASQALRQSRTRNINSKDGDINFHDSAVLALNLYDFKKETKGLSAEVSREQNFRSDIQAANTGLPVGAYTVEAATYGNVVDGMRVMEEEQQLKDRQHSRRVEAQSIPSRKRTVLDQAVATDEGLVPVYFHETQAKAETKSKKAKRKYSTKAQRKAKETRTEVAEGENEETGNYSDELRLKQQTVAPFPSLATSAETQLPLVDDRQTAPESRGGKGGGSRQAQSIQQRLEALTAEHDTKHALIGSGKLFSVVSANVNGAARVRKAGGAAQFAEAMLALRAKHDATVLCLQHLDIPEASNEHTRVKAEFERLGFAFILRSNSKREAKSMDKQSGRGVAIICSAAMVLPGSEYPKSSSITAAEYPDAYGFYVGVILQMAGGASLHVMSVYAPVNNKSNDKHRPAVNIATEESILKIRKVHGNIGTAVAADANSVMNLNLDTLFGSQLRVKHSFMQKMITQMGFRDTFRECHPYETAFSRSISKLHASGVRYEASRIDVVLIDDNLVRAFDLVAAIIDHVSEVFSDHSPVVAAFSTVPGQVVSVNLDGSPVVDPDWAQFVKDCKQQDVKIDKVTGSSERAEAMRSKLLSEHPRHLLGDKANNLKPEDKQEWQELLDELEEVYGQCQACGNATVANRHRVDEAATTIRIKFDDIAKPLAATKKVGPNPTKKERDALKLTRAFRGQPHQKAMGLRTNIQNQLVTLEGMIAVVKKAALNVNDYQDKDGTHTIDGRIKAKRRAYTRKAINEYNDLVREIRKNLALVRVTVEADIKATNEFYIDNDKADAKQAKQEDVLAKTLMEWVGALPIDCLRFMAGPADGESMKKLLVFARSEQKREDERRKVVVDEDGSESTCAACHNKCEQTEQLVVCDYCTRVYHELCCDATVDGGQTKWQCSHCKRCDEHANDIMEEFVPTANPCVQPRDEAEVEQIKQNAEDQWKTWVANLHKVAKAMKNEIVRAQRTISKFAVVQTRTSRLQLLLQGNVNRWYGFTLKKPHAPTHPIQHDLVTGEVLKNKKEMLKATGEFHQEYAKHRGEPHPALVQYSDEGGRIRYRWTRDDEEFDKRLASRLAAATKAEGPAAAEQYKKAFQKSYQEYPPEFCKKDWSTDCHGNKNPPRWPCQEMSDEEWEAVLKGPADKKRVDGFVLPAIAWMDQVIQDVCKLMVKIMLEYNLSPENFKMFLRIAIEKAVRGQYRHIAAATDWFAVVATIRFKRVAPTLQNVCPPGIVAYLPGRSGVTANILRQAMREDAVQAMREGKQKWLAIYAADDEKMFDSVYLDVIMWCLLALGAPEELTQMIAEDYMDNTFVVVTSIGNTDIMQMLDGLRQGNTMSCAIANIFNTVRIAIIQAANVLYEMEDAVDDKGNVLIKRCNMMFLYCDDGEQGIGGGPRVLILCLETNGMMSIVFRMGVHPTKTVITIFATEEEQVPTDLAVWVWRREKQKIEKVTFTTVKWADPLRPMDEQQPVEVARSLGYVICNVVHTLEAQGRANWKRVSKQFARLEACAKLTKIEMNMCAGALVGGSTNYDPWGCPSPDEVIRRIQTRHLRIVSRAYGMWHSDRKIIIQAPLKYGGDEQKGMFTEILLGTAREGLFLMNGGPGGEPVIVRWWSEMKLIKDNILQQEKQGVETEAYNLSKLNLTWMARNGITMHYTQNPVVYRILAAMVAGPDDDPRKLHNWTSSKTFTLEYCKQFDLWSPLGKMAVILDKVFDGIFETEDMRSSFDDECSSMTSVLKELTSARQRNRMRDLIGVVVEDIQYEWHTMMTVMVEFNELGVRLHEADPIWTRPMYISPPTPANLQTQGTEGQENINEAIQYIRDNLPQEPIEEEWPPEEDADTGEQDSEQTTRTRPRMPSAVSQRTIPCIELMDVFTDGSKKLDEQEQQSDSVGWSAVFGVQLGHLKIGMRVRISQRLPPSIGLTRISNNYCETLGITRVLELYTMREKIIVGTDSKVALSTLFPLTPEKPRDGSRNTFNDLVRRTNTALDRSQFWVDSDGQHTEAVPRGLSNEEIDVLRAAGPRWSTLTSRTFGEQNMEKVRKANRRADQFVQELQQEMAKRNGKSALLLTTRVQGLYIPSHQIEKGKKLWDPSRDAVRCNDEADKGAKQGAAEPSPGHLKTGVAGVDYALMHGDQVLNGAVDEVIRNLGSIAALAHVVKDVLLIGNDRPGFRRQKQASREEVDKTVHASGNGTVATSDTVRTVRGSAREAKRKLDKLRAEGSLRGDEAVSRKKARKAKPTGEGAVTNTGTAQLGAQTKTTVGAERIEAHDMKFGMVVEGGTKTYQGNAAAAMLKDSPFQTQGGRNLSQQHLIWYTAMFQTRTMRLDLGLRAAFEGLLELQVKDKPEMDEKEFPLEIGSETCCLCYRTHVKQQARGNVWHAMMGCPATRHACVEILLRPIEEELQDMVDKYLVQEWKCTQPHAENWIVEKWCKKEVPNLAKMKWLVPAYTIDNQRIPDNNRSTYGLAYTGVMCESIVDQAVWQGNESNQGFKVRERMKELQQKLVDRVLMLYIRVKHMLQTEYKSIRKEYHQIVIRSTHEEHAEANEAMKTSKKSESKVDKGLDRKAPRKRVSSMFTGSSESEEESTSTDSDNDDEWKEKRCRKETAQCT